MSTIAMKRDEPANDVHPSRANPVRLRLDILLAAKASRRANDIAFEDRSTGAGAAASHGRTLSFGATEAGIGRLASVLNGLRLDPGADVGLLLPNGSAACLTLLACQRAGLRPCLMSLAWDRDTLLEAIVTGRIQAIVTQTEVAGLFPAEMLRGIAANYLGLRFLCAFGDGVPDGVVALDSVLTTAVPQPATAAAPPETGGIGEGQTSIVLFERDGPRLAPIVRDADALVSTALPIVVGARITETARLVSVVGQDDLAGLACGLALVLATGARLAMHAVFNSKAFREDLTGGTTAHLVVPGWMEPALREAGLIDPEYLASLIVVHRPPVELNGGGASKVPIVDVVALGETALLVAKRDADGTPAIGLDPPMIAAAGPVRLTEARISASGRIEVRGRATATGSAGPGSTPESGPIDADRWKVTRFGARTSGKRMVAIYVHEVSA